MHFYLIIFEHSNYIIYRLLKIKNTWNTNEWLGDWSDGSKLWTEEYKEKVKLVKRINGLAKANI